MPLFRLALFLFLLMPSLLLAQEKDDEREDCCYLKQLQFVSMQTRCGKYYDNDELLAYWSSIYACCQGKTKNLYIHGERFIRNKLEEDISEELRQKYIDTLMMVLDDRMEHYGQRGKVLGKKGIYLFKYRPQEYLTALDLLQESIDLQDSLSPSSVVSFYLKATYLAYRNEEISTWERISNYEGALKIIDWNMLNNENEKYKDRFAGLASQFKLESTIRWYYLVSCYYLTPLPSPFPIIWVFSGL